jgi:hypothetical protein
MNLDVVAHNCIQAVDKTHLVGRTGDECVDVHAQPIQGVLLVVDAPAEQLQHLRALKRVG